MTQYNVWVSLPGGGDRVPLLQTDDSQKAANLLDGLLANSGSTSYDGGFSAVHADDAPPAGGGGGVSQTQTAQAGARTPHGQRRPTGQ